MVQHVLLAFIAPPLLLLGLTPRLAGLAARLPGLLSAAAPVPAQVLFAAVMLAWHLPVLYDLTLRSEGVHVFEHLTFIAAGLLYFWPVVAVTAATLKHRLGEVERVIYLLIGTLPQDTVGLVLLFAHQPFYAYYTSRPRLIAGIDPLTDQVLAGIALEAAGKVSYLVAILNIALGWFARARREEDKGAAAPA